jgi:hypothetical protein
MFGRMFWVAGDAAEGWEKKIEVVDPDPVRFTFFNLTYFLLISILASHNMDCAGGLGNEFAGWGPE